MECPLKSAKILIVDDDDANIRLLEVLLIKEGYENIHHTTHARHALPLCIESQPDLILLDLSMPVLDGFGVLEQLHAYITPSTYLPILVLTGDITPESKQRALRAGAKDFLIKSSDNTEILLRIKNLLETRFLHVQLQNYNQILEATVRERTQELREAQREILVRLGLTTECRDDVTGGHTQRVGITSAYLAQALDMSADHVELIRLAAPLHDMGKVGIPDRILLKHGKLTPDEFEEMKAHTTLGVKMFEGSVFPILQLAEEIASTHHERWDGTGYAGLKGPQIPMAGRIVSVADVFDALLHERPYKHAWTFEESVEEIQRQSGRQFDPVIVDAFTQVLQQGLITKEKMV